jgi:hypothetical protein
VCVEDKYEEEDTCVSNIDQCMHVCVCRRQILRESVLFIGTRFSNLYDMRQIHIHLYACVCVCVCV